MNGILLGEIHWAELGYCALAVNVLITVATILASILFHATEGRMPRAVFFGLLVLIWTWPLVIALYPIYMLFQGKDE